MYTVYTSENCPYCFQAKNLLISKGLEYTEINVHQDPAAHAKMTELGLRSVPQIFLDGRLISGGYQGLRNHLLTGELGSL